MACHGGLDGDLRSIDIPDLTNHNDIRILTEKRLQRCGEGHPHFLVDVDLIDTLEIEFDWILGGEDFNILAVHRVEGGIEGNRLARPGRSGNQ
ncbi:MAG: hypothetical protein ACD_75C00760G0002 [uncultured bacterium]|nr:MAG: hypothetical protein ACD_75C00760G0002 [uncultured bacterium]